MIQDIHPHSFENTYKANQEMTKDSYVFIFEDNSLLLKQENDTVSFPRMRDITIGNNEGIYLFSLDGVSCFWLSKCPLIEKDNYVYHEIRFLHTIAEGEIDFLSGVALHLKNWYEQHCYCGKCGSKTQHKDDERALVCSHCGHTVFPNISPAIIVAIICGDKILLARGVNFPEGFFSLVAGYTDVGETAEETIAREVREEVGIVLSSVRYYKSQPWAFSGSLMLAFIAEADDSQPIIIDPKEIAEANWYHRNSLPNCPTDRSIAGEIIAKFRNGEL